VIPEKAYIILSCWSAADFHPLHTLDSNISFTSTVTLRTLPLNLSA
jgi:hypothetical protein